MKKGYLIENYSITDRQNYIPPVKTIHKVLEQYNGKFLVATPKAEILSGIPNEVTIVIEFDSVEKVKLFYHSKEYKEFKELYQRTTNGWLSIAEEYHKK